MVRSDLCLVVDWAAIEGIDRAVAADCVVAVECLMIGNNCPVDRVV